MKTINRCVFCNSTDIVNCNTGNDLFEYYCNNCIDRYFFIFINEYEKETIDNLQKRKKKKIITWLNENSQFKNSDKYPPIEFHKPITFNNLISITKILDENS